MKPFDSALIPEGVERCPLWKFILAIGAVGVVVLWGIIGTLLCWIKALNQTNMNDAYGFALWIWADLAIIAIGGGAFFTGFLVYIIGKDELKGIINYAVLIGFCCYSAALFILGVDVGQPLRGWFIFWHANELSMLTEVAFCLSCYMAVLTIESIPLLLGNKQLDRVSFFHHLGHHMHVIMPVFAAVGAFLSFFHQGSLGGVPGVLFGRPFSFREGIFIWPWTFMLFAWSAAAVGPAFTILCTKITEKFAKRRLVKDSTIDLLAKISGWMLATYIVAKIVDTWYWATTTVPALGFTLMDFYTGNPVYGIWMLVLEIVICGIIPAAILITRKGRSVPVLLWTAAILAVLGCFVNRWAMVVQVLAVPVMPFEPWTMYVPNWQEWAVTILPVAGSIITIMLAYRYLPVFPHERELNPAK